MNKLTQSELRMQMLAGVITESEYKAKLEEVSALMKYASKDAKARDVEQSDREYIATRQKRDKLAKELFNKASYRDLSNVQKDRVNNQLTEDQNEEKDSLNEHFVAGGIVGIGAINQIPPRAKTDYEDAFEHFLGERYQVKPNRERDDIKDINEEEMNEGALMNEEYIVSIRTAYGTISDIEVSAENEEEAFNKAIDEVIDALQYAKLDQIERRSMEEGKEVEEPTNY
jgi:hypothetical protein